MACTGKHHEMHMCQIKARNDMTTYEQFAANAMVECEDCGAKAANPENVCNPLELPEIKDVGDGFEVR